MCDSLFLTCLLENVISKFANYEMLVILQLLNKGLFVFFLSWYFCGIYFL